LLLWRRRKHDERGATMPYLFLGPVRYVSHQAEKPMQIVWALDHPMPPDFYRDVKVAAG
jgi:hypothetical protein